MSCIDNIITALEQHGAICKRSFAGGQQDKQILFPLVNFRTHVDTNQLQQELSSLGQQLDANFTPELLTRYQQVEQQIAASQAPLRAYLLDTLNNFYRQRHVDYGLMIVLRHYYQSDAMFLTISGEDSWRGLPDAERLTLLSRAQQEFADLGDFMRKPVPCRTRRLLTPTAPRP